MNVLVLISGIADPKWPLPPQPDATALQIHASRYAVMSPFDEAALELALKLRDADPSVAITAVVAGGEALARKTAEWRLDAVHRFDPGAIGAWDCRGFACALAEAAGPLGRDAALLLIGREFGDFDDGSVPPLIAREFRIEHINLALALQSREGVLWAARQRGSVVERMRLRGPALLSVTNDSHNRLRHPLLKNVMAARKLQFPVLSGSATGSRVALAALERYSPPPRASACHLLTGTPQQQADALAEVLIACREQA